MISPFRHCRFPIANKRSATRDIADFRLPIADLNSVEGAPSFVENQIGNWQSEIGNGSGR
jgi:hypothetical protein